MKKKSKKIKNENICKIREKSSRKIPEKIKNSKKFKNRERKKSEKIEKNLEKIQI